MILLQMRTGQASEEDVKQRRERAMQDPEVQRILTDPVMRQASITLSCLQAGNESTGYEKDFEGLQHCLGKDGAKCSLGKADHATFHLARDFPSVNRISKEKVCEN